MTCKELQEILSKMPVTLSLDNGIEWYTKILGSKPWIVMQDPLNILEQMPDDVIANDKLSLKYDNATAANKGETPSVSDFKQLMDSCETIELKNDKGILLYNNGKYLYLPEGMYWTSSFEKDDVGHIKPIHVVISDGQMTPSREFNFRKCLNILGIKK